MKINPVIKSCGGKRKLVKTLQSYMPAEYDYYYEPFAGGLSLLLAEMPEKFRVNEFNHDIYCMYKAIASCPERFLVACDELIDNFVHTDSDKRKDYYLSIRENYPKEVTGRNALYINWCKVGSRFLFLNKTAYSGITRYNRQRQFNVPYGDYNAKKLSFYDKDNIYALSEYLSGGKKWIENYDFQKACQRPRKTNFYYLDPPYYGGFSGYTPQGFKEADHIRIRDLALKLMDKHGCYVMISNSNYDKVREIFSGNKFRIEEVYSARPVNSDSANRGKVKELIITSNNYEYRGLREDESN